MSSHGKKVRVSQAQWFALESVRPDGYLAETDRRVLLALQRRGWVREELYGRGRRPRARWAITKAGSELLASSPEIVTPLPRVDWAGLEHHEVERDHIEAASHQVLRPQPGLLWRVLCPADPPDKPLGYRDTKAEAVELLTSHYYRGSCPWSQPLAMRFGTSSFSGPAVWDWPV